MVNVQKNSAFVVLLFFLMTLAVVMCGQVPIRKRSLMVMEGDGGRDVKDQKSRPSKRTFCNAFTGCQGKRSDVGASPKDYDYGHELGKEPLDESTIDDVARDIFAEAKLWEALQSRNAMRYPLFRRQGFLGREKRATHSDDESFEQISPQKGGKQHHK